MSEVGAETAQLILLMGLGSPHIGILPNDVVYFKDIFSHLRALNLDPLNLSLLFLKHLLNFFVYVRLVVLYCPFS